MQPCGERNSSCWPVREMFVVNRRRLERLALVPQLKTVRAYITE